MHTLYLILSLSILLPILLAGYEHIREGGSEELPMDYSWRCFAYVAVVAAIGAGQLLHRIVFSS